MIHKSEEAPAKVSKRVAQLLADEGLEEDLKEWPSF
jgi:hypothetical protein